jgi:phosphomannomutase
VENGPFADKAEMRDEGALIAGDFSGHIFIADRYFGYDDTLYTTFRLVEIMKQTGKNILELYPISRSYIIHLRSGLTVRMTKKELLSIRSLRSL